MPQNQCLYKRKTVESEINVFVVALQSEDRILFKYKYMSNAESYVSHRQLHQVGLRIHYFKRQKHISKAQTALKTRMFYY